jgi:signal transduction histidine kinase
VSESIRRGLSAAVASAVLLAAVTAAIALLERSVPVLALGVIYLVAVVPVALRYGLVAAVATSLASMALFDYFFLGNRHSLELRSSEEWGVLTAFLLVGLLVSVLAERSQREARRSARLAGEQTALRRVATLVARAVPSAELFEAVTREAGEQCGADLARMERYEGDGTITPVAAWSRDGDIRLAVGTRIPLEGASVAAQVHQTGQPARVDSFVGATGPIAREAREAGIRASVGCPIVVGGRVWGVIAASTRGDAPFAAGTESQIGEFTELIATAVSNAQSSADLIASRARIMTAADEARRRLVRDLHDGAQQHLVSTILSLELALQDMQDDDPATPAVVSALEQARRSNVELRDLAHGVLPPVLTRVGLRAAVDALVSHVSVPVVVEIPAGRLPSGVEASAYFIVAEALTNIVKHAQAQNAQVSARIANGSLYLDVRDDGVGGADRDGSGLVGLDDRVAAVGGDLRVHSPPGGGTTIAATLPLRAT